MATNSDTEMQWVDAWNDLDSITGGSPVFRCMLDDFTEMNAETLKGWLQDSVYSGWHVKVEARLVYGKPFAFASRWKIEDQGSKG